MAFFSFLNDNSDITDITWRDRKRFAPMDKMTNNLMRGESELSIAQRELIAAYVSALNSCDFCYGSHQAVAERFGVNKKTLEQAIDNIDTADIDITIIPMMHYAKKLTLSPSKLISDDAKSVLDAGWSEAALQDVIAIVSLFNFYNRLMDGHGIKGNAGIYQFAGNHLSKRGYSVPWFINIIAPIIRHQKKTFLQQFSR